MVEHSRTMWVQFDEAISSLHSRKAGDRVFWTNATRLAVLVIVNQNVFVRNLHIPLSFDRLSAIPLSSSQEENSAIMFCLSPACPQTQHLYVYGACTCTCTCIVLGWAQTMVHHVKLNQRDVLSHAQMMQSDWCRTFLVAAYSIVLIVNVTKPSPDH